MPVTSRTPTVKTLTGWLMLAVWLGWITAGFSANSSRPTPEVAELARVQQALQRAYPSWPEQPVAVLLTGCDCHPSADSLPWQQLKQAMQHHGGQALTLPAVGNAPFELLLLDAGGQVVYTGPLQPRLPMCGRLRADPGQWLPSLLDASQPPLHLPSPCTC